MTCLVQGDPAGSLSPFQMRLTIGFDVFLLVVIAVMVLMDITTGRKR